MPRKSPEEQAAYLREWRARRREETGLPTLPGRPTATNAVTIGPTVLEPGEYMRMMAGINPKTGGISAETSQDRPKPRKRAESTSDTVENAKIALESRLARERPIRREWVNPFGDGLPETGVLIQRMSQHARDQILDRVNSKQK